MAVQTSFSRYSTGAKPGFDSDQGRGYDREAQNKTGGDIDVGLAFAQHSSVDSGAVALSSASQPVIGFSKNDQGRNPNGLTSGAYADGKMFPLKCEGALTVQCDQDMKPGDKVFVRFAASANGQTGVVGSVRKDSDGVAQVSTGTPTASQDSTVFTVRVGFDGKDAGTRPASYSFEYTSDGSMTATEVVTGLKAAMAADAAFTARVVATGTSTLILTGQTAGEAFTVTTSGAGAISWAATTPPAPSARRLNGARVLSSGTAASGVVEIYFSAAAESP